MSTIDNSTNGYNRMIQLMNIQKNMIDDSIERIKSQIMPMNASNTQNTKIANLITNCDDISKIHQILILLTKIPF